MASSTPLAASFPLTPFPSHARSAELDGAAVPHAVRGLAAELASLITRPWTLMEVCGGQTHAILRWGLDQLLPPGLRLIHGPGCPVCITATASLDAAFVLARRPEVILCSYGDMLRVPGSGGRSLLTCRAEGCDVRLLTNPLQALEIALAHPSREVVVFAVGFETTAPATALLARRALALGVTNLSLLTAHGRVAAAMEALLGPEPESLSPSPVQGFLAAGHVCSVVGMDDLAPLVVRHGVPVVVSGFEPLALMRAILECVRLLEAGTPQLLNAYAPVVRQEGNGAARALLAEVFQVVDQPWRGFGVIPQGGLALRARYASALDALQRFGLEHPERPCEAPPPFRAAPDAAAFPSAAPITPAGLGTDAREPTLAPTALTAGLSDPEAIPTGLGTDAREPTLPPTALTAGLSDPEAIPTGLGTDAWEPTLPPADLTAGLSDPEAIPAGLGTDTWEPTPPNGALIPGPSDPEATPPGLGTDAREPMVTTGGFRADTIAASRLGIPGPPATGSPLDPASPPAGSLDVAAPGLDPPRRPALDPGGATEAGSAAGLAAAPPSSPRFAWQDRPAPGSDHQPSLEADPCRAAAILRGRILPPACPAFGRSCTPSNPLGAPMVSDEGVCAAYHRHRPAVPPAPLAPGANPWLLVPSPSRSPTLLSETVLPPTLCPPTAEPPQAGTLPSSPPSSAPSPAAPSTSAPSPAGSPQPATPPCAPPSSETPPAETVEAAPPPAAPPPAAPSTSAPSPAGSPQPATPPCTPPSSETPPAETVEAAPPPSETSPSGARQVRS